MCTVQHIPHLGDVHTAYRQKIDEDITELEERILVLKSTRNTLSPIARLHAEVLQEVFLQASLESEARGETVLLMTWVCRSWRNLAHQVSALWAHIDFATPDWIQMALGHTKNRPLEFSLYLPSNHKEHYDRLTSIVFENLPRVTTFTLEVTSSASIHEPPRLTWLNPAPLLVKLDLHYVSLRFDSVLEAFPMLQTLALSYCDFDWNHIPIQLGIRHLTISSPISPTSPEDIVSKLHIIGPQVETITLDHTMLVSSLLSDHQVGTRCGLPKLTYFELEEVQADAVTFLLSQVSFPSRCDLCMQVGEQGDVLNTARALALCRGSRTWRVDRVEIELGNSVTTVNLVEEWPSDDAESESQDNPDIDEIEGTRLSFTVPNMHTTSVIGLLPLQPIKTIIFSGQEFTQITASEMMLHHDHFSLHTTIERLGIANIMLDAFGDILDEEIAHLERVMGRHGSDESLSTDQQVQCQTLLTFRNLTELRVYGEPDGEYHFDWSTYTPVQKWLVWRRRGGIKLRSLVLTDLPIADQPLVIEFFEDLVDEFKFLRAREPAGDTGAIPT